MEKAKLLLLFCTQFREIRPRRLQQGKCSKHIGLDKSVRPHNRTVYMAFRCKMDYGARSVLAQERGHQLFIRYVSVDENMAAVALQSAQVLPVPRVSEIVEVDNGRANVPYPLQHKIGADKPRAPGNQYRTRTILSRLHSQ